MVLDVKPDEAWNLLKFIQNYRDYNDRCLGIDVLNDLKEGTSNQDIINKIVEKILDED